MKGVKVMNFGGVETKDGYWRRVARRLLGDRTALAGGTLFFMLTLVCFAGGPLWAKFVAETTYYESYVTERIEIDGKQIQVVGDDGRPIGPTWKIGRFFLGANDLGQDVMVRLLFGGRNSLVVGFAASVLMAILALTISLPAGYLGGWVDAVLSRLLDVIWSFPSILLAVAIGVLMTIGDWSLGSLDESQLRMVIPALIIAVVGTPYLARPLRGEILSIREMAFIDAARVQGKGSTRIMLGEILPNLVPTLLTFFPLVIAQSILIEVGISFVGAGIKPPESSWGTMLRTGHSLIKSAPHIAIFPGLMLVLTVVGLNLLADGIRDAISPRSSCKPRGTR